MGELRDRKTKAEYIRKFNVYDRNKDGFISRSEIISATKALGVDIDPSDITTLMDQSKHKDWEDDNSKISYNDYINLMLNKDKYLSQEFKAQDQMLSAFNNAWIIIDDPLPQIRKQH